MEQSSLQKEVNKLTELLGEVAKRVLTGQSDDLPLNQLLGWYAPAITRLELADIAEGLANDIESMNIEKLTPHQLRTIQVMTERVEFLRVNTVSEMSSQGNAGVAIAAYISTLSFIREKLFPAETWITITDKNILPVQLARRAQAAQVRLDALIPDFDKFALQIEQIQTAHALADNLPIDLETLKESRVRVQKFEAEVIVQSKSIDDASTKALSDTKFIEDLREDAEKLIARCHDAMESATTLGLAGAFDQRAKQLGRSTWVWVFGLVLALAGGALTGATRFETLARSLQQTTPNWGVIVAEMFISLLSVGAPLWFAWLATKQIGQRFKLSEDYAFKASVAKAYEGYRREAARLDPEFERRLFDSALTRLDEAPLRFADTASHGSPWQELFNSDLARQAIKIAPDLQSKVVELFKDTLAAVPKVSSKDKTAPEEPVNTAIKE